MSGPPVSISLSNLDDGDCTVHACTTVGIAVVCVVTCSVESPGEGLALFAQLFIVHGDFLLTDASRDGVLVEDNIMWASLVVDPAIT